MTIELYQAPAVPPAGAMESPVSNTTGQLPEDEPALAVANLLGSFDSKEEAIAFVTRQATDKNRVVVSTASAPFDAYTHIEWLSVTSESGSEPIRTERYYLVTDEGY